MNKLMCVLGKRRAIVLGVVAGVGSLLVMGCAAGSMLMMAATPEAGVSVNGSQVSYQEWVALSNAAGGPVPAGSYWVDPSTGWAGVAGDPTPRVNIVTGQQSQMYAGQRGQGSPADAWLSGGEWSGSMTSGTVAPDGNPYHSVYSVDGEVLTLP